LPRARGRGARVTVRFLALAGLVALLSACGGSRHEAAPPPPTTQPKPEPAPKHHRPRHHALAVTVLDGDRRVRVPGARVELRGYRERTDRHGVTQFKGPRRRLVVSITKRGYTPVHVRLNFRHRYRQTVRIYQPALQWPVYGATEARTQAPTEIR